MEALSATDIRTLDRFVNEAVRITIVTHTHPDGDALGSSYAMMNYLRGRGKDVTVVLPDPIPDTLAFIADASELSSTLVHTEDPEGAEAAVKGCDLLVCQDFGELKRAEGLAEAIASAKCRKALIDHHRNPQRECFDVVFSEQEISSASELLFWVLMGLSGAGNDASVLPARCARGLMVGMTTDSNNFANSVYPSTLKMASLLLEAGVDRDAILSDIYQNYREERFRLMGYVLERKMHITADGAAYIVLSAAELQEFGIKDGDTEGFVNIPLGIGRVRMSIFLKEQGDKFRVSVRSKAGTSAYDITTGFFHGGGHLLASGGSLSIPGDVKDAADAERYVEDATKRFFNGL